ncbi:hypothetical protein EYZ11_012504 [Aspergillus tanneri]|uniref:RNase H type-1 domain-containing protein n=1 Tax=Aspergillus tanneri TaxID=1220188 RepID=A0A4S3J035_9EURO|nr:hypothetical protein EYZ11_012504 [Aspergillus tanneri]
MSDRILTITGIPQGSPLSPILYLLYNADLIEGCAEEEAEKTTEGESGLGPTEAFGWVDEVCMLAAGKTEQETITIKLQRACAKAQTWATKHASVFALAKYKLLHFVNPKANIQPRHTPLPLGDITVASSKEAQQYLGVWLDPELTFATHRAKAVANAGKSLAALRGLGGSTWGASLAAMRQIYQAVVIPQILYAVATWFQLGIMTAKERSTVTRQFASIQKRAAVMISGAFRTTATEALNTELYLLPMGLQMEQLAKETAIRIATGQQHAIPSSIKVPRDGEEKELSGWTPMEAHAGKRGGCLKPPLKVKERLETKQAYITEPWRAPPDVVIEEYAEARKSHDQILQQTNKPLPKQQIILAQKLRPRYTQQNYGVQMGLEMVKRCNGMQQWRSYICNGVQIFSDSQAALKALRRPRLFSGQEILRGCLELLRWCEEKGIRVTLQWIPAHQGVPGNEAADQLAKQAAQRGPLQGQQLVMLQPVAKRRIRAESKAKWAKAWQRTRTGRPTKRLIKAPEKGVLRYWGSLRKATSSVLMQVRKGRIGLNGYLSRINVRESARCGCDLDNQTPKHLLMAYPILTDLRMDLRRELRRKGCAGVWMEGYESVIRETKASVAVAEFIIKTGLLGQFQAVDTAATGVTNQAQDEMPVSARAR